MSLKEEERLRRAALRADDEFTAQLERAYGGKVGDARYRWHHEDHLVEAAMHRKLAADKAWWLAVVEAGR